MKISVLQNGLVVTVTIIVIIKTFTVIDWELILHKLHRQVVIYSIKQFRFKWNNSKKHVIKYSNRIG